MCLCAVIQWWLRHGVKVQAFQINITDSKAVAETAAAVKAAFGKIDYLFNNAGYQGAFTQAENYDPEDFKKVMDINVNGHLQPLVGSVFINVVSYAFASREIQ